VPDGNGIPREEPEVVLTQYVIYERPKDYPESFVVREWYIVRGRDEPVPGSLVKVAETLGDARAAIPDGLFNVGRQPGDDSVIVETWT
jgi:hypothetical protein